MTRTVRTLVVFVAVMLSLGACSRTKVISSEKNKAYKGGYLESVFLVMVSDNKENRKILENGFVDAFNGKGVTAVSSLSKAPTRTGPDYDMNTIRAEAEKLGMKSVFITYLVYAGDRDVYQPSHRGSSMGSPAYSMHSYDFQDTYGQAYDTGYNRRERVLKLNCRIFDADTEKLIWAVSYETIDPGTIDRVARSLQKAVFKDLRKNRLIR